MLGSKSLSPLLENIISTTKITTRPNNSKARYICQPCLQNQQQRRMASTKKTISIPKPTPFVPDVATFLTLIGRNLSAQASKFPTWESLFTQTSEQLREAGLEPARSRRYLLRWREKFRNGDYGAGGDLQHVENGTAELRIIELPIAQSQSAPASSTTSNSATKADLYFSTTHTPGYIRLVLNVPSGVTTYQKLLQPGQSTQSLKKPKGYKLQNGRIITGPYAIPSGHGSAQVKVTEGMWEDRLGQKVFGGERRRAEVLHKMGVAEHRKAIGTAR